MAEMAETANFGQSGRTGRRFGRNGRSWPKWPNRTTANAGLVAGNAALSGRQGISASGSAGVSDCLQKKAHSLGRVRETGKAPR